MFGLERLHVSIFYFDYATNLLVYLGHLDAASTYQCLLIPDRFFAQNSLLKNLGCTLNPGRASFKSPAMAS